MLQDYLKEGKCFKLVCGAGNEDAKEIEKLVTIYSLAGCRFFDICAKPEILQAAKNGLKRANLKNESYICVSVGINGDPHITKAKIDEQKCLKCKKCENVCPREAIHNFQVDEKRCIGCSKCKIECPKSAINMETKLQDYDEILPCLISQKIDCIEFHAISKNENDVLEKWNKLNLLYDGMLCISVDRSTSGDRDLVELVRKMVSQRKPFTTIIQADGVAMSGNDDEYGTTLQAVATAQMFQNAKLDAFLMMSGGTNTKSIEIARKCNVLPDCLAVGSYARKIVKEYLANDDILSNEQKLNEAVNIAKKLLETVK